MNGSVDALRYGLAPLGLSLVTDGDIAVIKMRQIFITHAPSEQDIKAFCHRCEPTGL